MLQKIIYPTGGSTIFNFEPHQYTSNQTQTTTSTISQATLAGVSKSTLSTSNTTFTWPANAINNTGTIALAFSANNYPGFADPAQQISLTDITANTVVSTWTHQGDNSTPYNTSAQLTFVPAHNYQVTLSVEGTPPVSVGFSLTGQISQTTPIIKKGGGLRIASIQNFDNNNALLSTEKYTYNGVNIGKNDAAIANNYVKVEYRQAVCGSAPPCYCNPVVIYYSIYYYGTAGYSGQNFEGANMLYGDVVKTNYDVNNQANGKTEFTYNTSRAFTTVFNPTTPSGFDFIDNSQGLSSLPASEAYYSSNTDGSFSNLKYKAFSYGGPVFYAEPLAQVYRNYIDVPNAWYCNEAPQNVFTLYNYSILIGTAKLAAVTETDYTQAGPITTTIVYSYDNPSHLQVTRITTTGSDGKIKVIQNKYPADFTDATDGSDQLRAQSINNELIEQDVTKNGNPESQLVTTFASNHSSVLRSSVYTATNGLTLEPRVNFINYDIYSNITQQKKTNGVNQSYQWGYNAAYPVAQVANAPVNDIFYDSFEEGDGTSTLGDAKTGHYCFNGTSTAYTKTLSGLDVGTYTLTYWKKTGTAWGLVVNTAVAVTGTGYTISIPAGNEIDDVRFYPSAAQMTTYTYDPLIGMTSSTDAKGQITYYEYDNFQRLMNIKDKDGNIIKHTDYHYQGQ